MKNNNKHNNKKGYTLIELIIVLSILSIGTFIVWPNLKVFSDKKARIEMDYAVDGIIELINTGKAYGRLKEKNVIVKFRSDDVVLMENLTVIEKFKFPTAIYAYANDSIDINGLGKIGKAQSINIYSKDKSVEPETITVKVGTSYVSRRKK